MKITKEEFQKISAEVIDELMGPTENGDSLPSMSILLFAMIVSKITHKLFENEEEIEIINTED